MTAGTYVVVLTVDGKEFKQNVTVSPDPDFPDSAIAGEDEFFEEIEEDEEELPADPVIR